VVNCDFHYAGCEVQVHRKDIPSHLEENVGFHLRLISAHNQILLKFYSAQSELIMRLANHQQQSQANQCQLRDELKLQQERSASKEEVDQLRQSQEQETHVLKRNFDRTVQRIDRTVQRIDRINKQQSDRIAQLNHQQNVSGWWLRVIIIVLIAIIAFLYVHVYHLEQHTLQSDLPG